MHPALENSRKLLFNSVVALCLPLGACTNFPGSMAPSAQHINTNTGYAVGLNLCFANLPAKAAESIDANFDDGNPATGSVRAVSGTTTNVSPVAAAAVSYAETAANTSYTVCRLL